MTADNIFISYSRSDSALVIKLEEELAKGGIDIWLDLKKITGGQLWDRAIEEALEASGIMILVISPNSALSENVASEVQYARDEGKIIIPILIGQTKIPLTWRRYQRIDFIENYEEGLKKLASTLKHEMSQIQNSEIEKEKQRLKADEVLEPKQMVKVENNNNEEVNKKLKAFEELQLKKEAEAKFILESANKNNDNSPFVIGQKYQGGIIFYIDATGQHGLIAAPSDQSSGIQWYNGTAIETVATNVAIGTGRKNTDLIVSKQGADNYAAKLCADLVLDDYDDWFLPSKDELNQLFENRKVVGGFARAYYWSSTESNSQYAGCQVFNSGIQLINSGTQLNCFKSNAFRVRAIRVY